MSTGVFLDQTDSAARLRDLLRSAVLGSVLEPGCPHLVADAERGAVLGPAVASVVEPGGADVGVAEPVLDAGDVGLVLEGVGGGGGPERVDDAFHGDGGGRGVLPDELVDAVAGERPAGPAGLGRLEEGCVAGRGRAPASSR